MNWFKIIITLYGLQDRFKESKVQAVRKSLLLKKK